MAEVNRLLKVTIPKVKMTKMNRFIIPRPRLKMTKMNRIMEITKSKIRFLRMNQALKMAKMNRCKMSFEANRSKI